LKKGDEGIQVNVFEAEPGSAMYEHKMNLQRVTEELLKFGVTANQAKIYIYLGKYGPKTAPEVFRALQLPRTETYFILNTLQSRGIINAELSSPTRYSALPLGQALSTLVNAEKEKLDLLAQQKKELTKIWDNIPSYVIETNETKSEKLQMVQGTGLIHSKIKDMIRNAKEEVLIFGSEKDLSRFYHADIIDSLSESLLHVRIILSPAQRIPSFLSEVNKKIIKVMPDSPTDNQCFVIVDSKEILFFLRNATHASHNLFGLWADSKSLIDSMHSLFDYGWENAEVCH
jgi:HTH-type transcriptional regulator, sugar sensing transcriptional regulator